MTEVVCSLILSQKLSYIVRIHEIYPFGKCSIQFFIDKIQYWHTVIHIRQKAYQKYEYIRLNIHETVNSALRELQFSILSAKITDRKFNLFTVAMLCTFTYNVDDKRSTLLHSYKLLDWVKDQGHRVMDII